MTSNPNDPNAVRNKTQEPMLDYTADSPNKLSDVLQDEMINFSDEVP
jgi:hypothetical protein